MKKINQLAAVAMTGLLGLSAYAAIPADFSTVAIKLTVLTQNSTISPFTVTKLKVTNKDVLAQVADEFGALPDTAQLVLTGNGFYGGTFAVLDKDGNVLIANASSSTDSYELSISNPNNDIYTGKDSATSETFKIITAGDFYWQDGTASNWLEVYGPATVKDTYKASGSPESFKFGGVEDGHLGGDDAIVTGSVSGKGKNTADF